MATEKKGRAALAAAPDPDPEPMTATVVTKDGEAPLGSPEGNELIKKVIKRKGEPETLAQLVFAGMPAGDQTAKLTGPITLPGEMLSGLTLGQVVHLNVTAIVTGVAGKAQRTEWGDDVVDVAWKLVVEEATVA